MGSIRLEFPIFSESIVLQVSDRKYQELRPLIPYPQDIDNKSLVILLGLPLTRSYRYPGIMYPVRFLSLGLLPAWGA